MLKWRKATDISLLSNGVRDPLKSLDIYRSKDIVGKVFGSRKERLDRRRTSVSSDENLDGKLFVQFVALILLSYITKVMNENNLFKRCILWGSQKKKELFEMFGVHM